MPSLSPGRSRSQRATLRPLTKDGFDQRSRALGLDTPGQARVPACAGRIRLRLAGSLAASQGKDAGNRCRGQQEQSNDHGAKDSASPVAQDRWT